MFIAYDNQRVDKPIGSYRQLFVDDDIIAAVKNVTRRQHTPRKHPANPLVERDTAWEHTPFFRTSAFNVIRDPADGGFRCWYEDMYEMFGGGFQFETPQGVGKVHRNRICYAQSADGIAWEKPSLGRYLIDGHDTNTVIWEADTRIGSPTVLLTSAMRMLRSATRCSIFTRLRLRSRGVTVPVCVWPLRPTGSNGRSTRRHRCSPTGVATSRC